ncbi:MAG: gamma-glutamyltransferase [Rhodospirillaceae bacterium]|jgi:gamma-glutamyltranspeptidase / glutathione hydrolase|nr:gamma-glutamyltransferase [Rhodospirillaceae bacterium]MBT5940242.1 gamma-glutamyltransferase [Rhodospirillaceae bacterium]MBT7267283.1 gamma-glutamyltransferase [Rhodospirillaceae bacterium]
MRLLDQPGRSTVHSLNGMAATSSPLSTATAIQTLMLGGNAMDAAIAAVAAQCVVEPQSTAIGGDMFCLYKPHDGDLIAFNGSGKAPAAATAQWYAEQGITKIERVSPHSVTVPGVIDGWSQLMAAYGTKSLGDVLQPAIRFAHDGFPVHHRVHADWSDWAEDLANDPTAAKYLLIDGRAPEIGEVIRQPLLGKTLEHIAETGRAGFYEGWVAEDIVSFLQGKGGLHTMEDFANVKGDFVTPIKADYKGYEVWECPPNGQGIVALEMLNILGGMDLAKLDPLSTERLHLEIEAARLAYTDRDAVLADPSQSDVPIEKWLSEEHAAHQRALIDRSKRMGDLPPSELSDHKDTVYLTVVDKDRNAVSFINTIFFPFGSAQVAPKSGVVLQNRGMGFSLDPDHPNCIAPNKRPLHTIIPGMLMKDGKAQMPFGVMGGQYQAAGHAHFLTNLLEWDMDLQEAIDFTRVFPDWDDTDNTVQVESGLPEDIRAELEALGHKTYVPNRPIGGAQAIWIDWERGVLRGGSDPRKDGCALGY